MMKTNNLLLLLHICLVILLTGSFTTIKAQTPVNEDDPVLRAMEKMEKLVDKHSLSAEKVLKLSPIFEKDQEGKAISSPSISANELIDIEPNLRQLLLEKLNFSNETNQVIKLAQQPLLSSNEAIKESRVGNISKLKLSRTVLNNYQSYQETLVGILQQEGMPIGLLSVALVESGFHPFATSPKGAKGIWQFMPATARRYGLTVESNIDYRTDPARSTRAAAQYLKDLYQQFGDWKLALAAYNAGENRIQRIINKTKIYSFDELARRGFLPKETANYVPAVLSTWPTFGKSLLFSQPENTTKPFKQSNVGTIIEASFKLGLPTLATSNAQ